MSAKPRMAGFFDNGTEVAAEKRVSPRSAGPDQGPEACCRHRANMPESALSGECGTDRFRTIALGNRNMAIRGMATVRQSITALYEESERSAIDGPPMLAVIDSEPPAPLSIDEQVEMNERPTIAARFNELRRLADLEMPTVQNAPIVPDPEPKIALPDTDGASQGADDHNPIEHARFDSSTDEILLPSEPPAPAAGNGASDLEVDDIRKLVQEAWEDRTAIAPASTGEFADAAHNMPVDDPDIESAMEDIAAAVVQSGDPASVRGLEEVKAELVAAVRAELQSVVETDLKAIVKAAVAEALKDMPAPKPATRARKAGAAKAAKKKASTTRSKDD